MTNSQTVTTAFIVSYVTVAFRRTSSTVYLWYLDPSVLRAVTVSPALLHLLSKLWSYQLHVIAVGPESQHCRYLQLECESPALQANKWPSNFLVKLNSTEIGTLLQLFFSWFVWFFNCLAYCCSSSQLKAFVDICTSYHIVFHCCWYQIYSSVQIELSSINDLSVFSKSPSDCEACFQVSCQNTVAAIRDIELS